MQKHSESSFPWFGILFSLAFIAVVAALVWKWQSNKVAEYRDALKVEQTLSLPEVPLASGRLGEEVVETAVEIEMDDEISSMETEPTPVLPSLAESDAAIKEKINQLDVGSRLLALLVSDEIIRKTVRAVHSLSEGWVVKEYRPISSPKGKYIAIDTGEYDAQQRKIYVSASANYERYKTHLDVLAKISPESAAELYKQFYPLMQQAYEELGLPKKSFHNVMLAALDKVLVVPEIPGELSLRQPSVTFIYSDTLLEGSSSLDKLKLRMGKENTVALTLWARAFRQQVLEFRG